jgi:hypothetical protein
MRVNKNYTTIFYILTALLVFVFLLWWGVLYPDVIADRNRVFDLSKDGVCIIPNIILSDEADILCGMCRRGQYKNMKEHLMDSSKLNADVLRKTGPGYVLQDYIWIIQKSVVHTCHRDNNGDFFNDGQKYPSYTLLIYLEDADKCLGVIPESHMHKDDFNYNLTDRIIHLPCKKGDAILFNANLIHVGAINKKPDNIRVQLKVTHKEDVDVLSYYQNFNKVLNEQNTLPVFLRRMQKRLTCMVPGIANMTQNENIRTARGSDNGVDIGPFQKMFSFFFYGNSKYYDLPNAF